MPPRPAITRGVVTLATPLVLAIAAVTPLSSLLMEEGLRACGIPEDVFGVVVGRGRLDGKDVLLAAQEGQFMGGTFGEVSGAKMVGLIRAARDHKSLPQTICCCWIAAGSVCRKRTQASLPFRS